MMREGILHQVDLPDWRWQAVLNNDRTFDGVFYIGVHTTGIFCRPSCTAKTPKRTNVSFYSTPEEAEEAGFRACLRCKPKSEYSPNPSAELISRAFDLLKSDDIEIATVEEFSSCLEVSPGYLQKTFKTVLGVSPKEVLDMQRIEKFKQNVKDSDVTTSLYDSGFGSSRSLYEKAAEKLGMTPAVYKKGGKGVTINYTVADSPLGKMLVAATDRGICMVSFGDEAESLLDELRQEFHAAKIEKNDSNLKNAVSAILKSLNGEKVVLDLPLDIRASAFQMRVWSELRKIPYGETRSYAQIAEQLGNRNAVRAVARACATNPVALVTPCHRVIASDGKMRGYRWGIERKQQLLKNEKARSGK